MLVRRLVPNCIEGMYESSSGENGMVMDNACTSILTGEL